LNPPTQTNPSRNPERRINESPLGKETGKIFIVIGLFNLT
jgi:hypothetical protein